MADRIGVCAECGSKFKIPPTFKGTKAKCNKCGGVVEITERAAPEAADSTPKPKPAPAAKPKAKPAPAAKAAPAPKEKGAGAKAATAKAPKKKSFAASRRAAGGKARAGGKRGGGDDEKSSNMMWILIVGGVSAVLVIVICIFMFSGNDEQQPLETPTQVVDKEPEVIDPEKSVVEKEPEEVAPESEPEAVEVAKAPEMPKEIDPVISFEPFPPIIDGDQEKFDRLTHCFEQGIIKQELPPFKRKPLKKEFEKAMEECFDVIPIFLNGFNGLDLLEREDVVVAFTIANSYWNKFTGYNFTDMPLKGDTTEDLMKENLDWNFKAVNSVIFNIWTPKVNDRAKQLAFFEKIERARARGAAKAEKEGEEE